MKKFILIIFVSILVVSSYAYPKYGTRVEKNISVPGYRTFDYVHWLHPGMGDGSNLKETIFAKKTLDFFKRIIPEGSAAIDIGAHTGDTSVVYSLVVGNTGKVIAFEPNPACFEILKMNAENNPNIIPVSKAITETEGNFTFHYTDPGLCNGGFAQKLSLHPYRVPVPVEGVNLENWLIANAKDLIPKIKFIKIDTEGYDRYIIRSIRDFLTKYRPIVQCELYIYLNKDERADLFNLLDSLQYKVVLGAYDWETDCSPVETRERFTLESLINYQLPTGPVDLLCIPMEYDLH